MTPIDRLTDALASAQRNNLVHAGTMVLTDDLALVLAVVEAAQRLSAFVDVAASPWDDTTTVYETFAGDGRDIADALRAALAATEGSKP